MSQEHFVIVGNGPAANSAAFKLRELNADARITALSRETCRQYQPNRLPDFIAGAIDEESLYCCTFNEYKEYDIKLRLAQEVVDADLGGRWVTLAHKEVLRFDGLIIATGGRPNVPAPLQEFRRLMLTLKTVNDAKIWIERLKRVDSVLVIGGDLTSFALTRALLDLGKRVRFIVEPECFWPLCFDEKIRGEAVQSLSSRGVEVIECRRVKGIARIGTDEYEAQTDAGPVKAGLVGAFFGLVPDVKFLTGTGLHIERGILVDEFLSTGFDCVYAAGDCAQVYQPELKDYWVSIGYKNAQRLGQIAASNLIGGRIAAEASPESIYQVDGVKVNTSWWQEF